VADLEGSGAGSSLPLLATDRRRHCTPEVTTVAVLWRHALQNIQNDCHQWLSRSFIKHKNLFSAGAPDPAGELTALPRPSIAGLS